MLIRQLHYREYREAVKRAKKAIALEPDQADGYFRLANAYADSGNFTNAAPQFLKTMEITDTGTTYNRQFGDERWARATSSAFDCLCRCDAPKPAWFTDTQQLKRTADRAVAALPEGPGHESYSRFAAHVEAELRCRIAADYQAALKLADD